MLKVSGLNCASRLAVKSCVLYVTPQICQGYGTMPLVIVDSPTAVLLNLPYISAKPTLFSTLSLPYFDSKHTLYQT